jgi:hypothetical protein
MESTCLERWTHVVIFVSNKNVNFIHEAGYPWISDPVGTDMEGQSYLWISWGEYPFTNGVGTV